MYKDIKLLKASIEAATKIDQSFERLFNILFYAVVATVVMALVGLDPLALFLSISTFVLAFSFMVSKASSNYFEGKSVRFFQVAVVSGSDS